MRIMAVRLKSETMKRDDVGVYDQLSSSTINFSSLWHKSPDSKLS